MEKAGCHLGNIAKGRLPHYNIDYTCNLDKKLVNYALIKSNYLVFALADKSYGMVFTTTPVNTSTSIAAKLLKSFGRAVKLLKKQGKGGKKKGIQI